jgi:rhamnosyltransferase
MNYPKVLVLMAAFNGSKWIREQVDTILNQVNVDVQLIVSDDGSTDDTSAIVERFAKDGRVCLVSTGAPTGSAAQNFLWLIRTISADGYDFVSFADQDDVWQQDKLHQGCSALIRTGAAGYSSAVTAFWSDGREKVLSQVATLTSSDFMFEGAGQGCTYVLTGVFYTKVRNFFLHRAAQTKYLHYHDWAIYALARSWNVAWSFDKKPSLRYRQHDSNDTGARTSIRGMRLRIDLIRSGWYARQLRAIADICVEASPADPAISDWRQLLGRSHGLLRACRIAAFCLRGGRRRFSDRIILLGSIFAGWI